MRMGPIIAGIAVLGGAGVAMWYFTREASAATGFVPNEYSQAACYVHDEAAKLQQILAGFKVLGQFTKISDAVFKQILDRLQNQCRGATEISAFEKKLLQPIVDNPNWTGLAAAGSALLAGYAEKSKGKSGFGALAPIPMYDPRDFVSPRQARFGYAGWQWK